MADHFHGQLGFNSAFIDEIIDGIDQGSPDTMAEEQILAPRLFTPTTPATRDGIP